MKKFRLASLAAGAVLGLLAAPAFAGSNSVDSTLTRLFPEVSYSTADGKPVFGYKVDLNTLATTNTQNKVSLTISGQVFDGTTPISNDGFGFAFGDGASFDTYCKAAKPGSTSITCSFGQLKSGSVIPSFFVWFTAPTGGTSVKMSGLARFAEQADGAGASNSTTPSVFQPAGGDQQDIGTEITTRSEIKSGLSRAQPADFKIGTSPNGTSLADQVQTKLTIPAVVLNNGGFFTTLDIAEARYGGDPLDTTAFNNCRNGAGFAACYQATVAIPNLQLLPTTYSASADLLTIALYLTPLAVGNSVVENKITVQYDGATLSPCVEGGSLPCVEWIYYFKTNNDVRRAPAGYTVERGSILAIVKNNQNGGLRIF